MGPLQLSSALLISLVHIFCHTYRAPLLYLLRTLPSHFPVVEVSRHSIRRIGRSLHRYGKGTGYIDGPTSRTGFDRNSCPQIARTPQIAQRTSMENIGRRTNTAIVRLQWKVNAMSLTHNVASSVQVVLGMPFALQYRHDIYRPAFLLHNAETIPFCRHQ